MTNLRFLVLHHLIGHQSSSRLAMKKKGKVSGDNCNHYQSGWGYKGSETALNGLTEWMYKNTDMYSYRRMCNLVIQFGLEHKLTIRVPDYDIKQQVMDSAHNVARQIQQKQLFQQFTSWITKNIAK